MGKLMQWLGLQEAATRTEQQLVASTVVTLADEMHGKVA